MRNVVRMWLFVSALVLTASGCHDSSYIDYYKVGEKVRIIGMESGCYAVILRYIPISKYEVQVFCHEYTTSRRHVEVVPEGHIEKRLDFNISYLLY